MAQQTSWLVISAQMGSSNLICELVSCWFPTAKVDLIIPVHTQFIIFAYIHFSAYKMWFFFLPILQGPSQITPGVIPSFFLNSRSILAACFYGPYYISPVLQLFMCLLSISLDSKLFRKRLFFTLVFIPTQKT